MTTCSLRATPVADAVCHQPHFTTLHLPNTFAALHHLTPSCSQGTHRPGVQVSENDGTPHLFGNLFFGGSSTAALPRSRWLRWRLQTENQLQQQLPSAPGRLELPELRRKSPSPDAHTSYTHTHYHQKSVCRTPHSQALVSLTRFFFSQDHNYATRPVCRKCNSPKPVGGMMQYGNQAYGARGAGLLWGEGGFRARSLTGPPGYNPMI